MGARMQVNARRPLKSTTANHVRSSSRYVFTSAPTHATSWVMSPATAATHPSTQTPTSVQKKPSSRGANS
jgi:hypothetical protein